MDLDLELERELEWELERELEWELEMGDGAEATESSGIPAGGPKIRTLGPNATFEHFRK